MIPLLLLGWIFLVAFLHPRRGVMLVALTAAFWLEWELPLAGIRLSVFEAAMMGGMCGLLAGNDGYRFARAVPLGGRVAAFAVVTVVSFIYTHFDNSTLGQLVWLTLKPTLYAVCFFLFYSVLVDHESLQRALRLYLVSATVSAVIGLVQVVSRRTLLGYFVGTYPDTVAMALANEGYDGTRAFSTLWHPTVFGHFMVIPFYIGVACLLVSWEDRHGKRMAWGAVALMALALLASGTRAAWSAFALSGAILSWRLRLFRHHLFLPLLMVGMAAFAGAYKLNLLPDTFASRLSRMKEAKRDAAMLPRYARWEYFWNRSMQAPWFGHGIVADAAAVEALTVAVSPHNTYLQMAVQRGWLATGIFAAILIGFCRCTWVLASSRETAVRGLGAGLCAGIIGSYTVGAMFDPLYEDTQTTVVFWLLLAISARYSRLDPHCSAQENLVSETQDRPGEMAQAQAFTK
jgi:O-antigen ligase